MKDKTTNPMALRNLPQGEAGRKLAKIRRDELAARIAETVIDFAAALAGHGGEAPTWGHVDDLAMIETALEELDSLGRELVRGAAAVKETR